MTLAPRRLPELQLDDANAAVVYLHAGQIFASAAPCTISTILGSCVAVCLVDSQRRVGGANHYLLPDQEGRHPATARYAEVAIDALVARMQSLGASQSDLRAKVFGGANVLSGGAARGPLSLGSQNVEAARRALARHGIPIVAEDVGGLRGRRLLFQTGEGHVWVRCL